MELLLLVVLLGACKAGERLSSPTSEWTLGFNALPSYFPKTFVPAGWRILSQVNMLQLLSSCLTDEGFPGFQL